MGTNPIVPGTIPTISGRLQATRLQNDPSVQSGTPTAPATTAAADQPWLDDALNKNWQYYKTKMMADGERVISNHYGGTISEGQSYALIKALHMNDKATFDKAWTWTQNNLQQRPGDKLLGWQWGRKADGSMGLTGDVNATDADQDIAYALLLASEKWGDDRYRQQAMEIIQDLWRVNVVQMHGKHYMTPGDWEGFKWNYQTLDPSYMAPYVYRKFAQYDTKNRDGWLDVAKNVYPVLEAGSNLSKTGLPPNWVAIPYDRDTVTFSDIQGEGARNFGYDAFRVFWRMSEDAAQGSPEAKAYLQKHTYLLDQLAKNGQLPEGYTPDGQPVGPANSGFSLSAALAQMHVLDPSKSKEMYDRYIKPNTDPQNGTWFNWYNDYLQSVMWNHLHTLKYPADGNGTVPNPVPAPVPGPGPTPPPPAPVPPPSPIPVPGPPPNVIKGVNVDSIKNALLKANTNAIANGRFGADALHGAWGQISNPVLQEIVGKLAHFARAGRTYTLDDLTTLAGAKGLITLEDADNIPTLLSGQRPATGGTSPNTTGTASPLPAPLTSGVTLANLRKLILSGRSRAEQDGRIDSSELEQAYIMTTDPVMKEILGKMDYFARTHNRSFTLAELDRLVAGGNITLDSVNNIPQRLNWLS